MPLDSVLLGLALVFGFYMAWNIGANDVANAMGTSVGSRVLTLKRAIIVAAVLEFCGAVFAGSHVTQTIRKGMFNPELFNDDIYVLVYGMLAALISAGVWLQIATLFGLPVSTTHSIVGAVIGFVIVAKSGSAVDWNRVGSIVASWGISPVLSGTISFALFTLIRRKIFFSRDPFKASKRMAPLLIFFVFFVLSLIMLFKGLKNVMPDLGLREALAYSVIIGCIASIAGTFIISRFRYLNLPADRDADNPDQEEAIMNELSRVPKILNTISSNGSDMLMKDRVGRIETEINKLIGVIKEGALSQHNRIRREISYQNTERIFAKLQILSACFVAFAHGSNDVANAIGPIAAVVTIIQRQEIAPEVGVPLWILFLGGIGIVIGLATWGYKVIYTIGQKITELSPSRGFSAEFGAAITIVFASKAGLPISTTHTLVGAVLGVGFAQGVNSLNLRLVRDIVSAWFITLPASALFSIIFYYILSGIF